MIYPHAKFSGKRLRDIRKQKEYTQKELAYYLDVTQSAYAKYERELVPMPINFLPLVSFYLNVDPNYLIGVVDYPFPYPSPLSNSFYYETNKKIQGE